ncbi:MAG: protein kinase [Planctomycetota bacterium]|nr:protein kinase [Planctomycetota bacterium]
MFPRVADFGLARLTDDAAGHTTTGEVLGTAQFMAPEQAMGQAQHVGPLSDVYGIGAILYSLLTGRPPFQGESVLDTLAMVRDHPPVAPSQLRTDIPHDLETICLKCLQKDPASRFASAAELADELRRFLEHRPILARPVGRVQKTIRWCRRNPLAAMLSAACVLVLLLGVTGITWKWREATEHSESLKVSNDDLNSARNTISDQVDDLQAGNFDSVWTNAELTYSQARRMADSGQIADALYMMLKSLRIAEQVTPDRVDVNLKTRAERRWYPFNKMVRTNISEWTRQVPERVQVVSRGIEVHHAAIDPAGLGLVISATLGFESEAARLYRFDLNTGKEIGMPIRLPKHVWSLAFHPRKKDWLAVGTTHSVVMIDLESGKQLGGFDVRGNVMRLSFDQSGQTLRALCEKDGYGIQWFWDTQSHQHVRPPLVRKWHERVILHPNGDVYWKVAGGGLEKIELSDVNGSVARVGSIQIPNIGGNNWTRAFWFHPDGRQLIAAQKSESNTLASRLSLFDLGSAERFQTIAEVPFPQISESGLRVSADGRMLFTMHRDVDAVVRHEVTTGREQPVVHARVEGAANRAVAIDPSQQWLIADGWRMRLHRQLSRVGPATMGMSEAAKPILDPALRSIAFSRKVIWHPDGSSVVTLPVFELSGVKQPNVLKASWRDLVTGAPRAPSIKIKRESRSVLARDGRNLVIWSPEIAPQSSHRWSDLQVDVSPYRAVCAVSPDGRRAMVLGETHTLIDIDLKSGEFSEIKSTPSRHHRSSQLAAYAPNGRLAVAYREADPNVWKIWTRGRQTVSVEPAVGGTDEPYANLQFPSRSLFHFDFLNDGRLVCVSDELLRIFDLEKRQLQVELPYTTSDFQSVAFDESANVLCLGTRAGNIQVHDLGSGDVIGSTIKLYSPVISLDVRARSKQADASRGAGHIVAGLADGMVQLLDLDTHRSLGPPMVHLRPVIAARITPDGAFYDTVSTDGDIRRWPIPRPCSLSLDQLERRLKLWTARHPTEAGQISPLTHNEWTALRSSTDAGTLDAALFESISNQSWHEARVSDAQQDGDAFGARWHLNQLIQSDPNNWHHYARRAVANADFGDQVSAKQDIARARSLVENEALLGEFNANE